MWLYVSNDSYPELREIESRWQRHLIWWRAFASGVRDRRFWCFAISQALVFGSVIAFVVLAPDAVPAAWRSAAQAILPIGAIICNGVITLTWGGDLIRPHLRRVSATARSACPRCGHQLVGHLDGAEEAIRCPECAAQVPLGIFEPPHRIPNEFLSLHW